MGEIKVGVSACLLGQKVRYDGSDKADAFLIKTLSRYFTLIPICPEAEAGLGVPRETIRLMKTPEGKLRAKTVFSERDVTYQLNEWIEHRIARLEGEQVLAFILKARSPSCAFKEGATVYNEDGHVVGTSPGLFTLAVMRKFPHVPIIEESSIYNRYQWCSFLDELSIYHRFYLEMQKGWDPASLEQFHLAHRLLIMSYSSTQTSFLDRLLKKLVQSWIPGAEDIYYAHLKDTFRYRPSKAKHLKCLSSLVSKLAEYLSEEENSMVTSQLHAFRKGELPIEAMHSTVIELIKQHHLVEFYTNTYLFPPAWVRGIRPPWREEKD